MRVNVLTAIITTVVAFCLSGCGGKGDTVNITNITPPAETSRVTGVASKGPISGGVVTVYSILSGTVDFLGPLGQGETDAAGKYVVEIGPYSGPVLVEVTGGAYIDEVSGATVTLRTPLRAMLANISKETKTVAITPLTELAYQRALGAGTPLSAQLINDSNTLIADYFNLADIVTTLPLAGGASDDEKRYAVANGGISQFINDNRNGESLDIALPRLLTGISNELKSSGGFSIDTAIKLQNAGTRFSTSGNNQTGTTLTPVSLPTSGLLKLGTRGTPGNIGAIELTIILPAGVTVVADPSDGNNASGVVELSGVAAATTNGLAMAKYTPATTTAPARLFITVTHVPGFGLGEFATIKFDLASGANFPSAAADFGLTGFKAIESSNDSGILSQIAPIALSLGGVL